MVDVNKIKTDLVKLANSMVKIGYDKLYVNRFLDECLEEVKNEANI